MVINIELSRGGSSSGAIAPAERTKTYASLSSHEKARSSCFMPSSLASCTSSHGTRSFMHSWHALMFCRCEVKVIDLGSSCFTTDQLSSYVQSRSYRAPEVILGLPYDQKVGAGPFLTSWLLLMTFPTFACSGCMGRCGFECSHDIHKVVILWRIALSLAAYVVCGKT